MFSQIPSLHSKQAKGSKLMEKAPKKLLFSVILQTQFSWSFRRFDWLLKMTCHWSVDIDIEPDLGLNKTISIIMPPTITIPKSVRISAHWFGYWFQTSPFFCAHNYYFNWNFRTTPVPLQKRSYLLLPFLKSRKSHNFPLAVPLSSVAW